MIMILALIATATLGTALVVEIANKFPLTIDDEQY